MKYTKMRATATATALTMTSGIAIPRPTATPLLPLAPGSADGSLDVVEITPVYQ